MSGILELKIDSGESLDLFPNTVISMEIVNPIFENDIIPGTFSYQFDVPATKKNRKEFGFPEIIQKRGQRVRDYGITIYLSSGVFIEGILRLRFPIKSDKYSVNVMAGFGRLIDIKDKKLSELDHDTIEIKNTSYRSILITNSSLSFYNSNPLTINGRPPYVVSGAASFAIWRDSMIALINADTFFNRVVAASYLTDGYTLTSIDPGFDSPIVVSFLTGAFAQTENNISEKGRSVQNYANSISLGAFGGYTNIIDDRLCFPTIKNSSFYGENNPDFNGYVNYFHDGTYQMCASDVPRKYNLVPFPFLKHVIEKIFQNAYSGNKSEALAITNNTFYTDLSSWIQDDFDVPGETFIHNDSPGAYVAKSTLDKSKIIYKSVGLKAGNTYEIQFYSINYLSSFNLYVFNDISDPILITQTDGRNFITQFTAKKDYEYIGFVFDFNFVGAYGIFKWIYIKNLQCISDFVDGTFTLDADVRKLILYNNNALDHLIEVYFHRQQNVYSNIINLAENLPEQSVQEFMINLKNLFCLGIFPSLKNKKTTISFLRDIITGSDYIDWTSKVSPLFELEPNQLDGITLNYNMNDSDELVSTRIKSIEGLILKDSVADIASLPVTAEINEARLVRELNQYYRSKINQTEDSVILEWEYYSDNIGIPYVHEGGKLKIESDISTLFMYNGEDVEIHKIAIITDAGAFLILVNIVSHGFENGELASYGLSTNDLIHDVTEHSFIVNKDVIDSYIQISGKYYGCIVISSSMFVIRSHGYANGTKVVFTNEIVPGGLVKNVSYYIISSTTDTFQLSSTIAGAVIPLTSTGENLVMEVYKRSWKVPEINEVGSSKEYGMGKNEIPARVLFYRGIKEDGDAGYYPFASNDSKKYDGTYEGFLSMIYNDQDPTDRRDIYTKLWKDWLAFLAKTELVAYPLRLTIADLTNLDLTKKHRIDGVNYLIKKISISIDTNGIKSAKGYFQKT